MGLNRRNPFRKWKPPEHISEEGLRDIYAKRGLGEPNHLDLDLDWANCKGKSAGHDRCGWCPKCELPRVACGHTRSEVPDE